MPASTRPSRLFLIVLCIAAFGLLLQDSSRAHGGTYRGPSSAPPASGGGGGAGAFDAVPPTGQSGGGNSNSGGTGLPNSGSAGSGSSTASGAPTGPAQPSSSIPMANEADWSQWWELNKDRYLDLKSRLYAYDITPGSARFFLGGWPASFIKDSLRPSQDQIRNQVMPALLKALETETHNEIITGCLIALAKSGRNESPTVALDLKQACIPFLADGNQEISETAALALGILGHDAGARTLQELLLDTEKAQRELVKSNRVHYRTRAFAAFGLSVIGGRTQSATIRSEIVATLFKALHSDRSGTKDVRVACLVALGRTPILNPLPTMTTLPREEWNPESCRVAEIDALRAFFESDDADFLVRAHAPTTLVSLLRDLPPSIGTAMKTELAGCFLDRVSGKLSEPREVVQGCIIALGQLADSDADTVDSKVRKTLLAIDKYVPDPLSRRLACIAIAQIAARPGTGAGKNSGRADLEEALRKGLNGSTPERPWSALAIGVLGRADAENGLQPSADLSRALLKALAKTATPIEVGAFSIAAGMVGIADAQPILQDKLNRLSVDHARGYLVLAMGLLGRRESIAQVQEIVRKSRYRPTLLRQAAVSLGLMGDKRLVPDLVRMMAEANGLATQAATASALGFIGDSRSVEPLLKMLSDKENFTDTARGFAAVSLGLVADDSDLPWNATFAQNINYRAVTPTLNDDFGTGLLNIL